jgi:DNA replicative helicase MCM subunit Mcm2 (Cdc46/Mcm family)
MKNFLSKVGRDPETNTIDINRLATGIGASQKNKIIRVLETIEKLKETLGAVVPLEEIEKELEQEIKTKEIEDAISKLIKAGDIYEPRSGHYQIVRK